MQPQQPSPAPPQTAVVPPGTPSDQTVEAPPKQVALAMDRLANAGRLIADIRIGADRLLEALFVTASQPHKQSSKSLQLILKEEASMRQHLQNLRTIDGAVVAYAWKRQLAGQAGASAVDRTRLALKAFTDQKRRFFPHLDDSSSAEPSKKKQCGPQLSEELGDQKTVSDILMLLGKEVPKVKTFTYQRLDWMKRASVLPSESPVESSKDLGFGNKLRPGSTSNVSVDKVSVIELLAPSIFRAIISLHPAGSTDPDAVAFFSPDEGGSYVHSRGFSVHHVFKHITEHASMALQYFIGTNAETALYSLLHWICSYETLFTKVCSKCGRLLSIDKESGLVLPPVNRPYRNFAAGKLCSEAGRDQTTDQTFHVGCFSEEA